MSQKRSEGRPITAERRRTIYRLAIERESVNATSLAAMLGVGISTVRRDLDALHSEGKLVRVHGGAIVRETASPRAPYRESRAQHLAEKSRIAEAAIDYLPESGTVFVGGGTTAYQLALRIPRGRDIFVVTNSLDIAAHLAANRIVQVDLIGGTIRPDSLQTNCEEALDELYWDVTFMGLAAVDIDRGITTDNRAAARQESGIIGHGSRLVALCDSSKIGRFAYAQMAPVSAMDVFVTDSGADRNFLDRLARANVEVRVAE